MARDDDIQRLRERIALMERAFQIAFDPRIDQFFPAKHNKKDDPFEYLSSEIRDLGRQIYMLRRDEQDHHTQALDFLATAIDEMSGSSFTASRIFPVTVFLDTNDGLTIRKTQEAIRQIIAEADLELAFEGDGIIGSWFGRFFARTKEAITSEQAKAELRRIERSLEMQALHLPQAQIDAAQSDGVAKLISALADTPNALVQIGSVLLIKVDGVPTVRNLTQVELAYLEHNKQLYKAPSDMLEELTKISTDASTGVFPANAGIAPTSGHGAILPPSS